MLRGILAIEAVDLKPVRDRTAEPVGSAAVEMSVCCNTQGQACSSGPEPNMKVTSITKSDIVAGVPSTSMSVLSMQVGAGPPPNMKLVR